MKRPKQVPATVQQTLRKYGMAATGFYPWGQVRSGGDAKRGFWFKCPACRRHVDQWHLLIEGNLQLIGQCKGCGFIGWRSSPLDF